MTLNVRPGYTTTFADANVQAYLTAVEEADNASLEYPVAVAINDFVLGCKADGIWTAIKASCILAGARTLTGALVPLVGTAPFNNNFVSGDYNRKTGLIGASGKFLNANRANNADEQNDSHFSAYVNSRPTTGDYPALMLAGSYNNNGYSYLYANRAGNPFFYGGSSRHPTLSAASSSSNYVDNNFLGITRANSTSFTLRVNKVKFNLTTPGADSWKIFDGSTARISMYTIGSNLDLALLDARVTALITAIGAAIP
jgi:hypothetical protein